MYDPVSVGLITASSQIPTTLFTMTILDLLGFDNNMLSGTIPSELAIMTQVDTLFFGNLLLEGTVSY